jgi:hypothetical protein
MVPEWLRYGAHNNLLRSAAGPFGLRLYATKKKKEAVLKKFHDVIIKRFTK